MTTKPEGYLFEDGSAVYFHTVNEALSYAKSIGKEVIVVDMNNIRYFGVEKCPN